ncbi:hypothetical protein [Rathayibacter soli]|uniref:hypothetical protein n=1 Tax=Rathayibacter soli TaxID=3144168 RepID=UPI0027E5556C|nr:hypothetical protein [Glaciibacter superstes]
MNNPLELVDAIGPLSYWTAMLLAILASLCLSVLATRIQRRGYVMAAAATLAAAVFLSCFPHSHSFWLLPALIGIAALGVSVVGGGQAVLFVLAMASRGSVPDGAHGGILVPAAEASSGAAPHEVLRGGTTIGLFERFATTAAIMAGFPEALAVIVAVKGVGRFTELDAAEARERFIIGTLVSLVWACACGALFRFVVG